MISRVEAIDEKIHPVVGVGHQKVESTVVVPVADGETAADLGDLEPRARLGRDLDEATVCPYPRALWLKQAPADPPGPTVATSRGFHVRSHHGETWQCLRRGVQAVDNAMNIWHINTLEHGVSLGVNPNYFFHMVFERAMASNTAGEPVPPGSIELRELEDMDWRDRRDILEKLAKGERLTTPEIRKYAVTVSMS